MPTNPTPNAGDTFEHISTGRNATAKDLAVLVDSHGWFPAWRTDASARKSFETAIAIALAESSGDTNAKNGDHYGLWQIGYNAHKDLFINNRNPYDPDVNCGMAIQVYHQAGNSFSPWTTYTSGKYTKFLGDAGKAASSQVTPSNGGAGDSSWIDKSLTKGKNAVDALNPANWIPSVLKFLRDGFVVIGASLLSFLLLGLGIWLLISNTKAGKDIAKAGALAVAPEAAPAILGK